MPSYVVITDSAGVALGAGPIYRATGWTAVNRLDRAGRCSFEVPAADPRAQELLANKREAHYYTLRDGAPAEVGALIIDQIETVVEGRSEPMLRVSGDNLLAELSTRSVHGLELYDIETVDATAVSHVWRYGDGEIYYSNLMAEAYDGNPATVYQIDTGIKAYNYLYVGAVTPISACTLYLSSTSTAASGTLNAQYFDGSAWQTLTISVDGTHDGTRTLGQSGKITFVRPADQAMTTHDDIEAYWVRLWPSVDTTDAIYISEVDVDQDYETTDGIADIMAYAPSGWTVSTTHGGYATTKHGAYMQFAGETVLEALCMLAEHTGEHFRLGIGKSIDWLQDDPAQNPVDSGVYAIQAAAIDSDNPNVCYISELNEMRDSYQQISRIYAKGAGTGSAQVTLAACTETPDPGYSIGYETIQGLRYYYLKHDATEAAIGRIEAVRTWSEAGQMEGDSRHAELAANELYQVAYEYLKRNISPQYAYSLRVVHLERQIWPGETMRVTYQRHRDGERYIDIDRAMIILGVEIAEDNGGIRTTALEVASTDAWPLEGTEFLVRELRNARRRTAGNGGVGGGTIIIGAGGGTQPTTVSLDTNNSVLNNLHTHQLDIASHTSNAAAHHAPVTLSNTGLVLSGQQVGLNLAPTSGLKISDGLMLANSVAGEGLIIANKVLSVGQGDGLTVSYNSVSLTTPGTLSAQTINNPGGNHIHAIETGAPNFSFSTTGAVGTGPSLVRCGATVALFDATPPPTLSAFSSGATGSAGKAPRRDHVHGITSYSDMSVNKGHLAKSDADGRGKWAALTATEYLRTSLLNSEPATALTIAPALDLSLSPGGARRVKLTSGVALQTDNFVSQTNGWRASYYGEADFRYVYTDELHAKAFMADLEQALAGGQIVSKSVAVLSADFILPAAGGTRDFYVKDLPGAAGLAVFQAGDMVRLRKFSREAGGLQIADAWGTVSGYADQGNGTQKWAFTRSAGDDGGTATGTVKHGTLVLDYGTTGNGYYEVNAIDGLWGLNSPYAQIVTWAGHPRLGKVVRGRYGNLRGIFNIADEYGLYAGEGVTDASRYLRISNEAIEAHNLPVHLYDGTNVTIALEPGSGTPSIAIGNPIPTGWLTQTGYWAGKDGTTYKQYVGQVSGGELVRGAMWDGTNYHVRGNLIVGPGTGFVVEDALLHCPFDGARPYETAFDVDLSGHLGQAPTTATGGLIGRPGVFGKAVQVAGATTNLIRNPSAETDIALWDFVGDGTSPTRERSAAAAWIGSYGLRWVLGSSPNSGAYCYQPTGIAPTQGTTYTGQVRFRALGSAIGKTGQIGIAATGGTQPAQYAWVYPTLTGEWQWASVSLTVADADRTGMFLRVGYSGATVGGAELHIDAAQVENRPYPTPYCDGSLTAGHSWSGTAHASSSSRTVASLSYANPLPTSGSWSLALWAIPAAAHITMQGTNSRGLWNAGTTGGTDTNEVWAPATEGAQIGWIGGGGTVLYAPVTRWAAYDFVHLAFTWDGTYRRIYYNGILAATSGDESATPPHVASTLHVGKITTTYPFNGWVDDLLILDRAMSADEILALYESGKPVIATTSPMSLLLTGAGRGKVQGNASGLFGSSATGAASFALATEPMSWGGGNLDAGDVLIGSVTANNYMQWDASAGTLTVRGDVAVSGTVHVAWSEITGLPDGGKRLGTGTPPSPGLWLTGSDMGYYNGSTWPVRIYGSGLFYFSKDGNNYVKYDGTTFEVKGRVVVTEGTTVDTLPDGATYGKVNKTIISGGNIQVGSGVKDSTLDGWNISSAEIVGQAAGVDQVVLGTDGKIKAGGGNVSLGSAGLTLSTPSSYTGSAAIRYNSGDTTLGGLYTLHMTAGSLNMLYLVLSAQPNYMSQIEIQSNAPSSIQATTVLSAISGSTASKLTLYSDSDLAQYAEFNRLLKASGGLNVGSPSTGAGTGGVQVEKYVGVGINYTPGDGDICAARYIRGEKGLVVGDGVTAPTAASGIAFIYVDSADGDLKVKFGDGTTKVLATDT